MAHEHSVAVDDEEPQGRYRLLAIAVRELLIERGVFTAEDVRGAIEAVDAISPELGARVVARAWVDPAYKERLLANGSAAVEELGIEMAGTRLVVVENTAEVHNLVVCTLCSCYPRPLLGLPPAWYKSAAYRARAVREPRAVLAEFGTGVEDEIDIRVHDSTADMRYLVLPLRPSGTEGLSEKDLARLVGRDAMIGVARVAPPG